MISPTDADLAHNRRFALDPPRDSRNAGARCPDIYKQRALLALLLTDANPPANLGYFSLSMLSGGDPSVGAALGWSLIPAGIGNVIGGTILVALPFWYLYGRDSE